MHHIQIKRKKTEYFFWRHRHLLRKVENCIERKRNLYPFYHYIIRLKLLIYDVRP